MSARFSARIETLTAETVRVLAPELLAIASDQPDEYWTLEHFLADLPEKWNLSFAAFGHDRLIGYAILSRKGNTTVHLHHFMVHPRFRGSGLGRWLMTEVERRARQAGAADLSLKFRAGNDRTQRFYERCGMRVTGPEAAYRLMTKNLT